MNTASPLIALLRPRTLLASVSPVLLALTLALKTDSFSMPKALLLLMTALMLQILCNIANDYFDGVNGVDHAGRVGPLRITGSGTLPAKAVRAILATAFAITLVLGICLSLIGGPLIASLIGLSILLALLYTSGPMPLSYRGFSEPFAFIFFGPLPVMGAYAIFSHSWTLQSFLMGCLCGCYSLIFMTLNNLRDQESDAQVSKKTLIVRYGRPFGKNLILSCLLSLIFLTFLASFYTPKILFSLIILPEAYFFYSKLYKAKTAQEFLPLFKTSAQLYLTHTILWIGFILL